MRKNILLIFIYIFLLSIFNNISAFEGPEENPPQKNAPVPLNTGTEDQVKDGGLFVDVLGAGSIGGDKIIINKITFKEIFQKVGENEVKWEPWKNLSPWNSNSNSDAIFFSNSVGIGTDNPNPAYSLDVAGDVNFQGKFFQNGQEVDFNQLKDQINQLSSSLNSLIGGGNSSGNSNAADGSGGTNSGNGIDLSLIQHPLKIVDQTMVSDQAPFLSIGESDLQPANFNNNRTLLRIYKKDNQNGLVIVGEDGKPRVNLSSNNLGVNFFYGDLVLSDELNNRLQIKKNLLMYRKGAKETMWINNTTSIPSIVLREERSSAYSFQTPNYIRFDRGDQKTIVNFKGFYGKNLCSFGDGDTECRNIKKMFKSDAIGQCNSVTYDRRFQVCYNGVIYSNGEWVPLMNRGAITNNHKWVKSSRKIISPGRFCEFRYKQSVPRDGRSGMWSERWPITRKREMPKNGPKFDDGGFVAIFRWNPLTGVVEKEPVSVLGRLPLISGSRAGAPTTAGFRNENNQACKSPYTDGNDHWKTIRWESSGIKWCLPLPDSGWGNTNFHKKTNYLTLEPGDGLIFYDAFAGGPKNEGITYSFWGKVCGGELTL